jgi:hypothetical protein
MELSVGTKGDPSRRPPQFNGRNIPSGQVASGSNDSSSEGKHGIEMMIRHMGAEDDDPFYDAIRPWGDLTLGNDDHDPHYKLDNRPDSLLTMYTNSSREPRNDWGGNLLPPALIATRPAPGPTPGMVAAPGFPPLTAGNMDYIERHAHAYEPGDIGGWNRGASKSSREQLFFSLLF